MGAILLKVPPFKYIVSAPKKWLPAYISQVSVWRTFVKRTAACCGGVEVKVVIGYNLLKSRCDWRLGRRDV